MPRKLFVLLKMNSHTDNSLYFTDSSRTDMHGTTVIFGGGLAGLSAGFSLVKEKQPVIILEGEIEVGGLARTIKKSGFRFDLGGHRFITKKDRIKHFVSDLLDGQLLVVPRRSKIYIRGKFFDYPLRPSNALFGLGISTTMRAMSDYLYEKIKYSFKQPVSVSLEEWVIHNFGRTMFNLYFKDYSEKVWGITCREISKEWISERIKGLSLWVALKNAFFKFSGQEIDTLVDKFIYPPLGIGHISDTLRTKIERNNPVLTDTRILEVHHRDFLIQKTVVAHNGKTYTVKGSQFISSIPLPSLVQILKPAVPEKILEAALHLKYRDLVVVTIMLNRDKVTDLTWLYLPEKDMAIGRIHEPKNWSPSMAPEGKTHIVSEYFCFENDNIWNLSDREITKITTESLERLGFIKKSEVIDHHVIRVPKAYPLFEIGYHKHYDTILNYLENFRNLHIAGRTGMFRYYNMDYAIESGIEAAEKILKNAPLVTEKESLSVGA
jgi:protoporphyrinogen oxidase